MGGLDWTFDELYDYIPSLTSAPTTPLCAKDLNPLISTLLENVRGAQIYAVGGHSVVLLISQEVVAKISLRAGCEHLRVEQAIFELLDRTPCPCIVQTFFRGPDIIFMEPLRNGTLQRRIKQADHPKSILPWMVRITKAVAYLEEHGYAHGDLNPRNIVFDDRDQPVLTDFDHVVRIGQPLDVGEGPYVRCALEQSDGQYGTAGAITEQFALGSIYWLVLTGEELYEGVPGHEVVDLLIEGRYPDTTAFGHIGHIIESCWHGKFVSITQLLQRISAL